MDFRLSNKSDLDDIMRIIGEASAFLHRSGVDQWNNGYPPEESFAADIERGRCYVGERDGSVEAVAVLSMESDPDYPNSDGKWLTADAAAYAVIHRMAMSDKMRGQGCAKAFTLFLLEKCMEKGAVSLRVDTHPDNELMCQALTAHGFTRCGSVYIVYGPNYAAHWAAFEKLLGE